jgi:hypothetical protein
MRLRALSLSAVLLLLGPCHTCIAIRLLHHFTISHLSHCCCHPEPLAAVTMPVCQGRPNAECPNNANDDTVKYTQGDLFLCHDCEEFRFPSSSSAKSGRGKAAKKPAQAAGARSKTLPHSSEDVASKREQFELPKGICHAPLCIGSDKPAAISCDTCHGLFHCECIGLDSQMLHQFCSLVHIIGWVCAPCRDIVRTQLNLLQSQHTDLACTVEKLIEDVAKLQREIVTVQQPLPTENSHPNTWPSLHSSKEHKKQLLAVVHADLEDSKRRHCNIVVSGLKPKPGASDVDLFLDVCERNLTLKPHVTRNKCRRLGRQQPGKIQPLLICLANAETANDLLAAAKQLRQSDDAEIRDQVYFNPDLTPGEAQAAYERRQRRRQRTGQQRVAAAIADTADEQPPGATSHQHQPTTSQSGRYQTANNDGLPADSNQGVISTETDDTANDDSRVHNFRSPQLNINAAPFKFDERVPSLS